MKNATVFILLVAFFLGSCGLVNDLSIEKRHYNNGFYVHKRDHRSTEPVEATVSASETQKEQVVANTPPEEQQAPVQQMEEQQQAAPVIAQHRTTPAQTSPQQQESPAVNEPAMQLNTDNQWAQNQPLVMHHSKPGTADADTMLIIMVILAILLSPLAVYMKEKATGRFWLDLICWVLGGGLFFSPFFYGGLLLLFAIVFALLIVLDAI